MPLILLNSVIAWLAILLIMRITMGPDKGEGAADQEGDPVSRTVRFKLFWNEDETLYVKTITEKLISNKHQDEATNTHQDSFY